MRPRRSNGSDERGIYLVLMAILIMVLLMLAALLFAAGYLTANKTRLQNTADAAALGAVEAFVRAGRRPYAERADKALRRAKQTLKDNALIGASRRLGDLYLAGDTPTDGGVVELGIWYNEAPTDCDPCPTTCPDIGKTYPCFVPNPGPVGDQPVDTRANAVRLEVRNQPNNPIIAPFMNLFQSSGLFLEAEATATVIHRCTAFLLDVSSSSTDNTHQFPKAGFGITVQPPPGDPRYLITAGTSGSPPDPAQFAYPAISIDNDCMASTFPSTNKLIWCNMGRDRPAGPVTSPPTHFWTDYGSVFDEGTGTWVNNPLTSIRGEVLIDMYKDPQPLTAFLMAMNATTSLLDSQKTAGDLVTALVFAKNMIDKVPPGPRLTADLGYMTQLSNIHNRPKTREDGSIEMPATYPNFVERGWFPLRVAGGTSTNIPQALHEAIAALSNPAYCPRSAKKSIIIFSDGIVTCDYDRNATALTYYGAPNPNCELTYGDPDAIAPGTYLDVESKLRSMDANPFDPKNNGYIYDLNRFRISVTSIFAGDQIQPHFINRRNEDFQPPPPPSQFLDPITAVGLGIPGFGTGSLVDSSSVIPSSRPVQCDGLSDDDCAWQFAGAIKDVFFRRPLGWGWEISSKSGGLFCPLLPRCTGAYECPFGYYPDGTLDDRCRTEDEPQLCSLYNLELAGLAAFCARYTVGLSPYILVSEPPPAIS